MTEASAPEPKARPMDIAAALAEIRDLQDEAGRAAFVHAIGTALGHPLLVRTHSSPRLFLFNVVVACDERPGGMDALLSAVEFLAPGTAAASRIRQLVSPVREVLPPTEQDRIRHLLVGRSTPSLARLYYVAAGVTVASPPPRFTDAWQAFSLLLDSNADADGVPPHLVFVELLARALSTQATAGAPHHGDGDVAEQLREWVTEQIATMRAEGGRDVSNRLYWIRNQPDVASNRLDAPMYLVIQLEPVTDLAGRTRDLHRLSHWRQIDPFEWRPEGGDDRLVSLAQAPEHVAELVQHAERDWAYPHDAALVIEFVLPMTLINTAVDQWTCEPGERFPAPMGAVYEVVVRSHDRLRERAWHRAWRRRWSTLMKNPRDCVTHWATADGTADLRRLRAELMARQEVLCCVLSCPPDREQGQAELRIALQAGLPVVVWHRNDGQGKTSRDSIRELIERFDIHMFPQEIKRLRMEANLESDSSAQSPWGGVTLLWDDPEHFLDSVGVLRLPRR